jgi:hypothetical protein
VASACSFRLPSARFSRDLDLFSREYGVQEAVADLERCAAITGLDPFTFQLSPPRPMIGGVAGVTVGGGVNVGWWWVVGRGSVGGHDRR